MKNFSIFSYLTDYWTSNTYVHSEKLLYEIVKSTKNILAHIASKLNTLSSQFIQYLIQTSLSKLKHNS